MRCQATPGYHISHTLSVTAEYSLKGDAKGEHPGGGRVLTTAGQLKTNSGVLLVHRFLNESAVCFVTTSKHNKRAADRPRAHRFLETTKLKKTIGQRTEPLANRGELHVR